MSPGAGITARPPRMLLRADGRMLTEPAVVVYRMEAGRHRQTGVVVEVSLDDYRNGRICRHEETRPARVRQLEGQAENTGQELMPTMLVHKGRLSAGLDEITRDTPAMRLAGDGVTHTVWVRCDAERALALSAEIARLDSLYIADGHHRMLAAERHAARHGHLGSGHPGAFTLAALFPSEEMRILAYHRCYALAPGTSGRDVLNRLAENPLTAWIKESPAAEPEPGVVAVGVGERWYRLRLHTTRDLDAFVIEQDLLPKLHDLTDQQLSRNSDHALENCWCDGGRALRLVPHPPTIDQVLAISDEGRTMPPKSTWFDPKPATQLFRRPFG